jgi:hypothetical protein
MKKEYKKYSHHSQNSTCISFMPGTIEGYERTKGQKDGFNKDRFIF